MTEFLETDAPILCVSLLSLILSKNVENVKCLEGKAGIKWANLFFLFNTRMMSTEAEGKAEAEGTVGKKRLCPWQIGYDVKVGYERDEEEKEINGIIFPEEHEKRMRLEVGEAFIKFVDVKVNGWYEKFLGDGWKEVLGHLFVLSKRAEETGAIYDRPIFWKACFNLYQKLFTISQQQDQDFLASRAKDWIEFFSRKICPAKQRYLFTWSDMCHWDLIKVVIIGQDPYPNRDHAHGLSFSAKKGIPPSLDNILTRLEKDYVSRFSELKKKIGPNTPSIEDVYSEKLGLKTKDIKHFPDHGKKFKDRSDGNFGAEMKARLTIKRHLGEGNLTAWAEQGVLLLNAALTTMEKSPGLHADIWKPFTMEVLRALKGHPRFNSMIFILWGAKARTTFQDAFDVDCKDWTGKDGSSFNNRVIISTHPSPLSALKNTTNAKAFMETETFTRANDLLIMQDHDVVPIDWMNLDY